MKLRIAKVFVAVLGVIAVAALLVAIIGPFLIPIKPLDGLVTPEEAAGDESRFVTVPFEGTDGIDIHYLASGQAAGDDSPTFVLLHGSLFNASTWTEVTDFLGERGRVIAYDQIPYGLSEKLVAGDWTDRNPYAGGAAVDQLFAFLDVLGEDSVVLVGHSYGGVLAAEAALAEPERVEVLVLVDPALYVREEVPAWVMNLPQVRRLGPLFARQIGGSEGFVRQTYLDPGKLSDERLAQTLIHTEIEDWDQALWEYLRVWGAGGAATSERVGQIQQPTLVISGEGDAVVPVADSERLHSELVSSELVVLPSCGHVPQEECPEAFEEAVDSWLSSTALE